MSYMIIRTLRAALLRWLPRMTVSGGLMALAAALFLLDHRWTDLTWGALALAAGAFLTGRQSGQTTDPRPVRVRHVPDPGNPATGFDAGIRRR